MTLEQANEFVIDKFVDMYICLESSYELGERGIMNSVQTIKAKPTVTKCNTGLSFTPNKPELSEPASYPLQEIVYSIRFDQRVLRSQTLLKSLVKDFLIKVNYELNREFKCLPLIGTTYPTFQPPGFEGKPIREVEPGIYEMRVYTDFTPKRFFE